MHALILLSDVDERGTSIVRLSCLYGLGIIFFWNIIFDKCKYGRPYQTKEYAKRPSEGLFAGENTCHAEHYSKTVICDPMSI